MIEWLNKQNKKHVLLFDKEGKLNKQDLIIWFELALNQHSSPLNKKITKIAPRRTRIKKKNLVQVLRGEELTTTENFQEIIEFFDEHS